MKKKHIEKKAPINTTTVITIIKKKDRTSLVDLSQMRWMTTGVSRYGSLEISPRKRWWIRSVEQVARAGGTTCPIQSKGWRFFLGPNAGLTMTDADSTVVDCCAATIGVVATATKRDEAKQRKSRYIHIFTGDWIALAGCFSFFSFFLLDGSPSRPTRRLLHGGPNPGGAIITDLGTPPWGKRLRQRDSSLPIWQMEAIGSALIRPAPHSGHRLGPFGVRPVRLRWLKVRRRARLKQKANELSIFFLKSIFGQYSTRMSSSIRFSLKWFRKSRVTIRSDWKLTFCSPPSW